MKATKLILAIAFFAFSTMVFTQTARPDYNEPSPNLNVKISFRVAVENPRLVEAMHVQLDERFLLQAEQRIYTVLVTYRHVHYVIWGTRSEWKNFFSDPSGIDL